MGTRGRPKKLPSRDVVLASVPPFRAAHHPDLLAGVLCEREPRRTLSGHYEIAVLPNGRVALQPIRRSR